MSRRADCWDNAPMESFFASLKKELVHDADFATRAEARAAIVEYIEVFYNNQAPTLVAGVRLPGGVRTRKTLNPVSTFRGELHPHLSLVGSSMRYLVIDTNIWVWVISREGTAVRSRILTTCGNSLSKQR